MTEKSGDKSVHAREIDWFGQVPETPTSLAPSAETVTVSAQNRNFPGRSGPGKLYLASPYVVAASAIAGKIVEPFEFLRQREQVA